MIAQESGGGGGGGGGSKPTWVVGIAQLTNHSVRGGANLVES